MKEKVKFLWIYTGILFSFALILIVFAYLTQNNMNKETTEISKGYKSNIERLTKENEKLRSENEQFKQNEINLNEQINSYKQKEEINKIVEDALKKLDEDKKSEAKELVKDIDKSKTSDLQNYIIDKINE